MGAHPPALQLQRWLNQALEIVAAARQLLLDRAAAGFEVRLKADASFVTEVDLAVETLLRDRLAHGFPTHGQLGEEFGASAPSAEFQWLIDPIDGTLSFSRGIPLYGTIVALHQQGRPLLGIIDHAGLDRCYSAGLGLGSHCNGRRLQLGPPREQEVISVCDRSQFVRAGRPEIFERLLGAYPLVRVYSDCFGHTLAASGAIGAAVDWGLNDWDIAASRILLEEAGGRYVQLAMSAGPPWGVVLGQPTRVAELLERLDLKA